MKKLALAFSALILILTSCSSSSDDSTSTPVDTSSVLLKKVIETYGDGSVETTDFVYNGNKIVSIISDFGDKTVFTYTGELITKEEFYLNNVLEDVSIFEYNASQKLIKSTRTTSSDVEVDNFTYNTNSTVTFTTTSNGVVEATGTFYFNGDQPYKKDIARNVIDPLTGDPMQVNTVEEMTFDNKVNPFINVLGFSKIIISLSNFTEGFDGVSNNTLIFKMNNIIKGSSTYTYNSNNMPATEVYDDIQNNFDSNIQYIYN
jgi:hypothetical protein